MMKIPSHVIGFDDAPFARPHRGDVLIVGVVFSGLTVVGVASTKVRRDGANATDRLVRLINGSRFRDHLQAVLLQGIAFAGFNVVDIQRLHEQTRLPVVVVSRKQPDYAAIRAALTTSVAGGERKWRLIDRLGPMEALNGVYVQRVGLTRDTTAAMLRRYAINGMLPEPLRLAHLIAGGIAEGESRHRA